MRGNGNQCLAYSFCLFFLFLRVDPPLTTTPNPSLDTLGIHGEGRSSLESFKINSNGASNGHIWCNGEESCARAVCNSHILQGSQEFIISCSDALKSCDITTLKCLTPSYDDVFGEGNIYKGCRLDIEGSQTTQNLLVYSYLGYDFLEMRCRDDDILVEIDGSSDTYETMEDKIQGMRDAGLPISCEHASVKCGEGWAWECDLTPFIKNISNYSSLLPSPNSVKNVSLTDLIGWRCLGDKKCS